MSNSNPNSYSTTRKLNPLEDPNSTADPQVPLRNLSLVRTRMDSLHHFLSQSINTNASVTVDQITVVSNEIVSAIHQIIINGAALVSHSQNITVAGASKSKQVLGSKLKFAEEDEENDVVEDNDDDCEIVELDAVELLAEHIHFCEICGKGFRRDANLRMHMRAHGNQFKTPEALAKPLENCAAGSLRARRFSCPFDGCNRNKLHRKFKPLKSIVCVKNHFKRCHCPKMYSCNRCHKKNFSVLSDLKSHMRNCGESKWKCSCGSTFSRKDKLFGHIALFEGHMPALALDEEVEKGKQVVVNESELGNCSMDDGFFDDFGSIDNYCLEEVLGFPGS